MVMWWYTGFNSLQTGKAFRTRGVKNESFERICFNSLQTGKAFRTPEVTPQVTPEVSFNSLQTGKGFPNPFTKSIEGDLP